MTAPYVSERALTPAQAVRVGALTVTAGHGIRSADRALQNLLTQPVLRGELIGLLAELIAATKADPARMPTLQGWLSGCNWVGLAAARKAQRELAELVGAEGTVRDHAFAQGLDQIGVGVIDEQLVALEAQHATLQKLRRAAA